MRDIVMVHSSTPQDRVLRMLDQPLDLRQADAPLPVSSCPILKPGQRAQAPTEVQVAAYRADGVEERTDMQVHRLQLTEDEPGLFECIRTLHQRSADGGTVAVGCRGGQNRSGLFTVLLHQRAQAQRLHDLGAPVVERALTQAAREMIELGQARRGPTFASCALGDLRDLPRRHAEALAAEFSPSRRGIPVPLRGIESRPPQVPPRRPAHTAPGVPSLERTDGGPRAQATGMPAGTRLQALPVTAAKARRSSPLQSPVGLHTASLPFGPPPALPPRPRPTPDPADVASLGAALAASGTGRDESPYSVLNAQVESASENENVYETLAPFRPPEMPPFQSLPPLQRSMTGLRDFANRIVARELETILETGPQGPERMFHSTVRLAEHWTDLRQRDGLDMDSFLAQTVRAFTQAERGLRQLLPSRGSSRSQVAVADVCAAAVRAKRVADGLFGDHKPLSVQQRGTADRAVDLMKFLLKSHFQTLPPQAQSRWRKRVESRGQLRRQLQALQSEVQLHTATALHGAASRPPPSSAMNRRLLALTTLAALKEVALEEAGHR
ncbi:hypothetical protein [Roseateles amylovorans]|uniref:Tyrosine specific protein phosphatases domain-containing protein n=1 Tax=Roseateles amylovorans TaxID=2978473 RepID=A0ABY6AZ03_9BURK|nr:hypothetical protein [Roseateles amylovorans]UXH78401.1 hypothetical protein N4261_00190 [Roseateles amylovorans]